jgi:hypothetical protein
MSPTDGCQIPQGRETPRLGEKGPSFCGSHEGMVAAPGCRAWRRFALGSSDQCSRTPHCGDTLARAGDVLALVSQLPSTAPGQSHGSRNLISPFELTRPIFVGQAGVGGGIGITYSDALQPVLAESLELPPNVHGGLSTGCPVCDHNFSERYVKSRDLEH